MAGPKGAEAATTLIDAIPIHLFSIEDFGLVVRHSNARSAIMRR